MPHQCLNCGKLIEKGSDEILKGCAGCGGKKFMYVDKPLPEEERLSLKNRADEVRDEIIKRSDEDLYNMLEERGISSVDDLKASDSEWLRVEPDKEKTETVPGDSEKRLELVGPRSDRKNSAKEMISSYDRSLKEKVPMLDAERPKGKAGKKKKKPKKPAKKPSRQRKREPKKKGGVDVITIEEQGVYNIDVKRLLEDNPIIIQKDGSYLIHLPSVFESRKKRK